MLLSPRFHRLQSRLARYHRAATGVGFGFVGEAANGNALSSSSLPHQSSYSSLARRAIPRGHPESSKFSDEDGINRNICARIFSTPLSSSPPNLPQFGSAIPKCRFASAAKRRRNKINKRKAQQNKEPKPIKKCLTIKKAAYVAHSRLNDMSPEDIADLWMGLAHVANQRNRDNKLKNHNQRHHLPRKLNEIFSHTMKEIESFDPRYLAMTALGLAKTIKVVQSPLRLYKAKPHIMLREILVGESSQQKELIFQSIAKLAVPVISEFDALDLSNLAYAIAIADNPVPVLEDGSTLFDHIAEKSSPLVREFDPQRLCNMIWSFGHVRASHPRLFEEVANAVLALDNLDEFIPQNLSNMVLAFAKAGESHPQLFEKIGNHISAIEDFRDFYPMAISNVLWSFAKAQLSHPLLFEKMASHIVAQKSLNQFNHEAISNTVWAFAMTEEPHHPTLYRKVAVHILALQNLVKFTPKNLSDIVWSFAEAGEPKSKVFGKVADHIVNHIIARIPDKLHSFKPEELANTVWAFAKNEESHPQLFEKLACHIVALDDLNPFNPQELSKIVWSFAKAEESHPELFDKMADHIVALESLQIFRPEELSKTVWAFAWAEESHPELFQKVAKHMVALEDLSLFSAHDVSDIVWAFARARESQPQLFQKVADHILAIDNLNTFGTHKCFQILQAFETAQIVHTQLFEKITAYTDGEFNADCLEEAPQDLDEISFSKL